jgi:hypothetical protein
VALNASGDGWILYVTMATPCGTTYGLGAASYSSDAGFQAPIAIKANQCGTCADLSSVFELSSFGVVALDDGTFV